MARITIPCLIGKTNMAGITSWYWQPSKTLAAAGFTAMTLGKDEGAALAAARTRNAEVADWKAGGPRPNKIQRRVHSGTVAALVTRYRREMIEGRHPTTGLPRLKPKTIEAYQTGLKRILAWAGDQPLAFITPARVRALRNATAKPPADGGIGHSPAFNLLKTLRQLLAFAETVDLIPKGSNPAASFDLGAPAPRSTIWEADDQAAFIAAAYDKGLPSMALAIEIALYSCQREGDLIAFTEAQLQELEIHNQLIHDRFAGTDGKVMGWSLAQLKTSNHEARVLMEIPLEPQLRGKIEAAIKLNRARDRAASPPRLLTHVLVDDRPGPNHGLPWKKRAFIEAWRSVLTHAAKATHRPQMNDLVWHDLRRTRVVRLRRRGMDPAMIASITGHSPQSIGMMLKVYGPVDPTMTAAALASTLDPLPAAKADQQEQSA